jgi:hypothetical protein
VVKADITLDMAQEIMDLILFLVQLLQRAGEVVQAALQTEERLKGLGKVVALEVVVLMAHGILAVQPLQVDKEMQAAMAKPHPNMVQVEVGAVRELRDKVGYLAVHL